MGWVMKLKLLPILVAILGWVPPTGAGADTLFQSIPDLTANPVVNAYCSPCYGRGGGVTLSFLGAPQRSIRSVLIFWVITAFLMLM